MASHAPHPSLGTPSLGTQAWGVGNGDEKGRGEVTLPIYIYIYMGGEAHASQPTVMRSTKDS